ncbi:MAG: trigger factor [Candidatus Kerfeldbacteria bacterium RIFCSPHIGHO2_02_FULL_42_14]|uniref:Trigger factor n=1 Tax=Candidatus Kerfeldbacteria bacterium RIFCSPHIGHO2_02_FULL_42_14 TaxID=1798540 RepID=A0A1G2AU71_9BACT|nr:MAG: trigger factor [Candidatus Kerfeldbacteria bacterium RIFCSPHIGHO2_02_FULL_42_14]OGY81582.1 MAG: trigger factor [Candidatus Kerfeldbacteria bacterium RIFCSPHIGHO2_12_FULL_42_13]OGY83183.1 MAG: trigger factor [Candidatus Kerfeldbacteria bacterium RIFCSPLOWO2_02_FULL_42_19]OGY86264.1 MAG: trigger factor [Candidatus Kerfeldbacteria bacterium RIFCSPLOWO2_12_FULL_43_9]
MNVTHKNLPKSQVELRVELTIQEVEPFVQKAAQHMSQEVKIPGFRPGHVPMDILKRHVGNVKIYEEAFREAVMDTLPRALTQERLEIIGSPNVTPEKLAPGNPLIYNAIISVYPTVELGAYRNFRTAKKSIHVQDKEVEKTLESLRRLRASQKLVQRAVQKGDKVLADLDIFQDNVLLENGSFRKQEIDLNLDTFVAGFSDQVIGMQRGEEKRFSLRFPKDYHTQQFAGKEAEFRVQVHEVYEVMLPELKDDFAQSLGNYKNLVELREALRVNLHKEGEYKERLRLETEVLREVVERTKFGELPEVLITSEIDRILAELKSELESQGGKFDDYLKTIKKTQDQLQKDLQPQALQRVKSILVLREIALKEKIQVDAKQVTAEIDVQKKRYENDSKTLKYIESEAYERYIRNMFNTQKVVDFLVEQVAQSSKQDS